MKQLMTQLQELRASGRKSFSVLFDPDQGHAPQELGPKVRMAQESQAPFLLVGGSLVGRGNLDETVRQLKELTTTPIILFPGNHLQVSAAADGILFLSLISGRNPEFLIGQHVLAAPILKKSTLQVLPTGYMLVDPGHSTSASYMSGTVPLPADKPMIAASTAMAGEMLGLQCLYLDAGSGAKRPVPAPVINRVRRATSLPLIVGGGIRSAVRAQEALMAGADLVVIGNGVEENPGLVADVAEAVKSLNDSLEIHQ